MSTPQTSRLSRSDTPQGPARSGAAAGSTEGRVNGSLHVSVRPEADGVVVVLVGELDIATAPHVRSVVDGLLLEGRNRIVVDLDAVTFLDAAAIEAVITATSAVALSGGTLHVTHHPAFMRLLQFTLETHRVNVARAMEGEGPERAVGTAVVEVSDRGGDGAAGSSRGTDPMSEDRSDAELPSLLGQSAGGNEEAFAAVYDATAARAYGLGLRMLDDSVLAGEVVQEAYVYLWRNSALFQQADGSAISWILAVVHRCAVRRVRSEAARAAPERSRPQTVTRLQDRALVELRSTQGQAVELAYFGGHTHTEVEKMTGLPVGTAHVRIRAGLLALPDRMGCGEPLAGQRCDHIETRSPEQCTG